MAYSFCESTTASSRSPWCIRRLTDAGRKTGGGVDTPSLCGRVREGRGWDLTVELVSYHLTKNACPACKDIFDQETRAVELTK